MKNLKVGDRVRIKPTGQIGKIIRITDNPYLPDWMSRDRYHVIPDGQTDYGNYADCTKRMLELLKKKSS